VARMIRHSLSKVMLQRIISSLFYDDISFFNDKSNGVSQTIRNELLALITGPTLNSKTLVFRQSRQIISDL